MPHVPLRALVTGFGPFPGIVENASATVAPRLVERIGRELPGIQAMAAVLPTEWDAAPRLLGKLAAELQPHVCLHFGVSGSARGVVVETYARNDAGERRDAAGRLPRCSRLLDEAPGLLMPGESALRLALRAASYGLPVKPSLEAGDYVCNAVYFHSLWLARRRAFGGAPGRQVAFLHLPVRVGAAGRAEDRADEAAPLAMKVALAAAMRILTGMLEAAAPRAVSQARAWRAAPEYWCN